jgi:hypothetical protein
MCLQVEKRSKYHTLVNKHGKWYCIIMGNTKVQGGMVCMSNMYIDGFYETYTSAKQSGGTIELTINCTISYGIIL